MIEAAMFAFLGFLAAGLLALLLLPAVWRRAVRLTQEAVLATHPSTYREVKAAQDAVRAEAALTQRRLERELERVKTQAAQARAEAGKYLPERLAIKAERSELSDHRKEVDALLAAQTDDNSTLREDLELARAEARELAASLTEARKELGELRQLLDSRKGTSSDPLAAVTISALEAQIASLQRQLSSRPAGSAPSPVPVASEAMAAQVQPDSDAAALRKTLARLESELLDREADFIAAQADVARLTLQLDLAGGLPDGLVAQMDQSLKDAARDNARLSAKAAAQDRALARTRAEINRLNTELAASPAIQALRDELKALAAKVISGEGETPTKPKPARSRKAAAKGATGEGPAELPAPATPATAARLSAVEIAGRIVRASAAAREALSTSTAPQPGTGDGTERRPAKTDAANSDAPGSGQTGPIGADALQTTSPPQTSPRGDRKDKKQVVA